MEKDKIEINNTQPEQKSQDTIQGDEVELIDFAMIHYTKEGLRKMREEMKKEK